MTMKKPDIVFELSWEVCNMVGGIHTVIQSKAAQMRQHFGDDYICIGPLVPHPIASEVLPAFREEIWSDEIYKLTQDFSPHGVRCSMGRWSIEGKPKVLLIGFGDLYSQKDRIFSHYWEHFGISSLFGGHDYTEPVLFAHACALMIEQIYNRILLPENQSVVVQAHEWMTAISLLHLKESAPEIGTVFTTHATVLGRSLSSRDVYKSFESYLKEKTPIMWARENGIESKFSLEVAAARETDCFTTVSQTTSSECELILGKKADVIVHNGLSDEIPSKELLQEDSRNKMRLNLLKVAEKVTGFDYVPNETFTVITSGRYEFRNKGVDLYLDSILDLRQELEKQNSSRRMVAFIMCPAGHLQLSFQRSARSFTTHQLTDPIHDPIMNAIRKHNQLNSPENKVHVIFVPDYLNGSDPDFPQTYWELLSGCDLAVFASLYEPWGYTPHEAVSLGVPTITTDFAGFGRWAQQLPGTNAEKGVIVLPRSQYGYDKSRAALSKCILDFFNGTPEEHAKWSKGALQTASHARWHELINGYLEAFSFALKKSSERAAKTPSSRFRSFSLGNRIAPSTFSHVQVSVRNFSIMARFSNIRKFLQKTLDRSMSWKWHPQVLQLLHRLDPMLWEATDRSPSKFIANIRDETLLKVSNQPELRKLFEEILHDYKLSLDKPKEFERGYFCMEYGLADKLRIYSGGLGILAGDHLKTATDMKIPLAAFGLFYQYGYFRQIFGPNGQQVAHYHRSELESLSLTLVQDEKGGRLLLSLPFANEELFFQVWRIDLREVNLYLLDSNVLENPVRLRSITDRLYGTEPGKRISQEWLLSMGGLKVAKELKLGIKIFHMNEGHTAFLVVGRTLELMEKKGLTFDEAFNYVRFTTIFTTHTPVPAGHDEFALDEAVQLLKRRIPDQTILDRFIALGASLKQGQEHSNIYSMTGLALRGSRWINAVSKIHEEVSQKLFNSAYPDLETDEVPVSSVTNGVHATYWLDCAWQELFHDVLGAEWPRRLSDAPFWKKLNNVPISRIRETKLALKKRLIEFIKERLATELERGSNRSEYAKILGSLDTNTLIITHARRIAPYKRTDLLFQDLDRLAKLIRESPIPVLIIYAGKAHPADNLGQEILPRLFQYSRDPRFRGSVLILEGYNLSYARRLMAGSDIWLNTPIRPLEASGTSGMKAAINGTPHLSVADGWWPEAYNGKNGWMLGDGSELWDKPLQDEYDRTLIFQLLETEIFKTYGTDKWYEMVRESIVSVLPIMCSERMLSDYQERFYRPALKLAYGLEKNNFEQLKKLTVYKKKIQDNWSQLVFKDINIEGLNSGKSFRSRPTEVILELSHPGLTSEYVQVQAILTRRLNEKAKHNREVIMCECVSEEWDKSGGASTWRLILSNREAGEFDLAFRAVARPCFEFDDSAFQLKLIRWM